MASLFVLKTKGGQNQMEDNRGSNPLLLKRISVSPYLSGIAVSRVFAL